MRVVGILFLVIFVPESLIARARLPALDAGEIKEHMREAVRQTWTGKAKNLNFLHILTSKNSASREIRRNLIVLAGINTIMFGAFMGAMNVMLLYSEVGFQSSISSGCPRFLELSLWIRH